MEPFVPIKKLEPGVYQGSPEPLFQKMVAPPRLFRTMKTDMAEAVKNQNETIVSIKIADEKKQSKQRAEAVTEEGITKTESTTTAPKPVGRFIVVIILLIIIALFAGAYVYISPKIDAIKLPRITLPSFSFSKPSQQKNIIATSSEALLAPSLIPGQSEKIINITHLSPLEFFNDIKTEIKKGSASASVKNFYITEDSNGVSIPVSASRIFIFANAPTSDILIRALEKPFMLGLFGEQSGRATPFIILKVSDRDAGLAGMLEWEMDMPTFFNTMFDTKFAVDGKIKFRDVIVNGNDARAIDSPFTNTIIYAFANKNTIVITGSQNALETILPIASKN